ncbi:MAG: hypothetical protein ACREQR_01340 [Candidatus Binataceae bacterium]
MSAAPPPISYASIAAFLAHYRSLNSSRELSGAERRILTEMRAPLDWLESGERAALESDADDSAARRHRERAMRKLSRELISRGIISG